MFASATRIAARILGAGAILLTINTAIAEGLPEGATVKVIAEYPSGVPALETVRLIKVTMQPGSKFDNVLIEHEEYCRLEQGQLTRIIHDFGTTNVLSAGASWARADPEGAAAQADAKTTATMRSIRRGFISGASGCGRNRP